MHTKHHISPSFPFTSFLSPLCHALIYPLILPLIFPLILQNLEVNCNIPSATGRAAAHVLDEPHYALILQDNRQRVAPSQYLIV